MISALLKLAAEEHPLCWGVADMTLANVQGKQKGIIAVLETALKDQKLKKVQASIQGDQVRVSSPSKDDLQDAIALLRKGDFGVELKFGNYR